MIAPSGFWQQNNNGDYLDDFPEFHQPVVQVL